MLDCCEDGYKIGCQFGDVSIASSSSSSSSSSQNANLEAREMEYLPMSALTPLKLILSSIRR
jgi:hypothetical protein